MNSIGRLVSTKYLKDLSRKYVTELTSLNFSLEFPSHESLRKVKEFLREVSREEISSKIPRDVREQRVRCGIMCEFEIKVLTLEDLLTLALGLTAMIPVIICVVAIVTRSIFTTVLSIGLSCVLVTLLIYFVRSKLKEMIYYGR